jgi:T4 RnlA family RNA ligase
MINYENDIRDEVTQRNMYVGMMRLVEESDAFLFADYERDTFVYRVFNYRLASYTDFLQQYTREMRGITFIMNDPRYTYPRIVSRPFEKFFNWGENPLTINLDLSKATRYEEKADGSLISTYVTPDSKVYLKSKQAFYSEQALMAEEWLAKPENLALRTSIQSFACSGYTVLMELCSPANRIVLEYPKTTLKIHGIRSNVSGKYISKIDLDASSPLYNAWVGHYEVKGLPNDFIASTELLEGIEGYIVHGPWGRFKIKTKWYQNLHHLKDSVSSTNRLVEAILYERIDDIKAMFSTDEFTMQRIQDAEDVVIPKFNHIVKTVIKFYEDNKILDRKSYAIKGQTELKDYFSLGMNLYLGKEADYRLYCLKYQKEVFNVEEDDTNTEEG